MSDWRESHKNVIAAEKADDATAIRIFRAVARNARENPGLTGFPSAIESLCDRLEAALKLLAQSGNYVADEEVRPTCVWFQNGRRVAIRVEGGASYLEVDRSPMIALAECGSRPGEGPSTS